MKLWKNSVRAVIDRRQRFIAALFAFIKLLDKSPEVERRTNLWNICFTGCTSHPDGGTAIKKKEENHAGGSDTENDCPCV